MHMMTAVVPVGLAVEKQEGPISFKISFLLFIILYCKCHVYEYAFTAGCLNDLYPSAARVAPVSCSLAEPAEKSRLSRVLDSLVSPGA